MKTLPIILISYSVTFLPTVYSIMCERCFDKNVTRCTSSNVTCGSSVKLCCSSITALSHKKLKIEMPQKFCGIPGIQNISYSITLNQTHIASEALCCESDVCNKAIPQTPPRNLTKNEMKCPYCIKQGLGGCEPMNQTLCTGLEVMCVHFSGYLGFGGTPKEMSYQGCATPSACPQSTPDANSNMWTNCTKAVHRSNNEGSHSMPIIN
ncbi:phospholipase A2 inhibitor and Ly6/PLAUR domain-containing protein-like [Eleutherodactylus coqui]|uniref:phospholipase A2 inhibitor and Ly6/PLAUR domain-containing protein-like n=1 Tax=Eleutherodactylus coqui TaxID=57060 RepID=UPI003462A301